MMKKMVSILTGCITLLILGTVSFAAPQQSPHITGTVPTAGHMETDYPSMARITMTDAIVNATNHTPGEVLGCDLESQDGFLTYQVEIVTTDATSGAKTIVEVSVDAGDGQILAVQLDSENDRDGDFQEQNGKDGQFED